MLTIGVKYGLSIPGPMVCSSSTGQVGVVVVFRYTAQWPSRATNGVAIVMVAARHLAARCA